MPTLNQVSFPSPETFECPHCRQGLKLYDPNGCEFYACPNCNSYLRFKTTNNAVVQKNSGAVKEKPIIPLGAEGQLKGYQFKVIAYLEKKEKRTVYSWKEYLLYNYEKGYATLSVFEGHWNFILDKHWEPSLEQVHSDSATATHQNTDYRIFNKYTPAITGIIGEFDWDVLSDHPKINEYIAPPFILFRETGATGTKNSQYYWGEYTEPEEIAKAFGLDISTLPAKNGIGANQPSSYSTRFGALAKYTMLAFLGLLLLHFLIKVAKPERELLNADYSISFDKGPAATDSLPIVSSGTNVYEFKPFLTSSFEQPDGSAPLEIELGSYVNNNWLEATVILVNENTNETWEVSKGIEFYNGYESGEYWQEGSRTASITLTEIPRGKYHLNIYPASGDATQTYMHITIKSNITLWKNIFLAFIVLCLYPAYCWFRGTSFEQKRWLNSDYSPYEEK